MVEVPRSIAARLRERIREKKGRDAEKGRYSDRLTQEDFLGLGFFYLFEPQSGGAELRKRCLFCAS